MVDQINAGMEQQANGTDDGTADSPIKRAAKEAEEDANTPASAVCTHTRVGVFARCVACVVACYMCARSWLVGCIIPMVLTCLNACLVL